MPENPYEPPKEVNALGNQPVLSRWPLARIIAVLLFIPLAGLVIVLGFGAGRWMVFASVPTEQHLNPAYDTTPVVAGTIVALLAGALILVIVVRLSRRLGSRVEPKCPSKTS